MGVGPRSYREFKFIHLFAPEPKFYEQWLDIMRTRASMYGVVCELAVIYHLPTLVVHDLEFKEFTQNF